MSESLEEVKENIRAACDIVDVIGGYIGVKRAGSGFKALCPFHKEKTPSFTINQPRQSYHCFGCGAGGDVFKFVMEQEGVDFMTALRMLADRAGISFTLGNEQPQQRDDKDVLYRLHDELADFYQRVLLESDAGRPAREYLKDRDIGETAIADFRIGFAPNGNSMLTWGRKNDFSPEQLVKAGVLVEKDQDSYDRFRGRVMFSICDALGRVIGFSGRVLNSEQSPAKYLNSPETMIFKKSNILYGFHRARKRITELRQALVCEGQLDCIRCHLAGFENAIAPQGTALTEQQARIIKRQADSVVLLFDSDEAGGKAAVRAAEIMLGEELSVAIAVLPAGSDPDTLIREQGPTALRVILDAAQSPVAFLIDRMAATENMNSQAGVMRVARETLAMIARSSSAVQRDQLIRIAAQRLNLSESALLKDLAGATAVRPERPSKTTGPARKYPPDQLMTLSCLHHNPALRGDAREFLTPAMFSSKPCRTLLLHMLASDDSYERGLAQTLPTADEETITLAARIDNRTPPSNDPDYPIEDIFFDLILRLTHKHFRNMREQLRRKPDKDERERFLYQHITPWMAEIKTLQNNRNWDNARCFLKTVLSDSLTSG